MANRSFIALTCLFLAPISRIVFGDSDICSQVSCGKGTCESKPVYIPYGYLCECDSGWRQTLYQAARSSTIDYSCMSADPPLPPVPINPYNVSIFNPCYWVYCGEGTCMKSSDNTHLFQFNSGAYNLLNVSHFPCYRDCAVGSDCSKLGIQVPRESVSISPGSGSTQNLSSLTSASNTDGELELKVK